MAEKKSEATGAVEVAVEATELAPEELLRIAADRLEARRGLREKSAKMLAAEVRNLAAQVESL